MSTIAHSAQHACEPGGADLTKAGAHATPPVDDDKDWESAVNRRPWSEAEQILHLLEFIKRQGLKSALDTYAAELVAEEDRDECSDQLMSKTWK